MPKFPVDAPIGKVIKTLQILGFRIVRQGNHHPMEESPHARYTKSERPIHNQ